MNAGVLRRLPRPKQRLDDDLEQFPLHPSKKSQEHFMKSEIDTGVEKIVRILIFGPQLLVSRELASISQVP